MGAGYKGDQSNNTNLHLWEPGSNMAAPVPRLTVFIRKPSLLEHQLPVVGSLCLGSSQSSIQKLEKNAGPTTRAPLALLSTSPSEWPWRLVAFLMVIILDGGC